MFKINKSVILDRTKWCVGNRNIITQGLWFNSKAKIAENWVLSVPEEQMDLGHPGSYYFPLDIWIQVLLQS